MMTREPLIVAVFFQNAPPPEMDGAKKPFKPGGYRDSGADIAFTLREEGVPVLTPEAHPRPERDADWVFPDSAEGIHAAYAAGARVFWMNTVLYAEHPLNTIYLEGARYVGQEPASVAIYDDKFHTNQRLADRGLPIAASRLRALAEGTRGLSFPFVMKPVRGRGSQGVAVVRSGPELAEKIGEWSGHGLYGERFIAEAFLPGEELTFTVLPPGRYELDGRLVDKNGHWALPAVKRVGHEHGIAPYSGLVAVSRNSAVMSEAERTRPAIRAAAEACEKAGALVGARAPIRIDCRADEAGLYRLFDLNLKPNITGAGRPGRDDQDSLLAIAARAIGWSYGALLRNVLGQAWTKQKN